MHKQNEHMRWKKGAHRKCFVFKGKAKRNKGIKLLVSILLYFVLCLDSSCFTLGSCIYFSVLELTRGNRWSGLIAATSFLQLFLFVLWTHIHFFILHFSLRCVAILVRCYSRCSSFLLTLYARTESFHRWVKCGSNFYHSFDEPTQKPKQSNTSRELNEELVIAFLSFPNSNKRPHTISYNELANGKKEKQKRHEPRNLLELL